MNVTLFVFPIFFYFCEVSRWPSTIVIRLRVFLVVAKPYFFNFSHFFLFLRSIKVVVYNCYSSPCVSRSSETLFF